MRTHLEVDPGVGLRRPRRRVAADQGIRLGDRPRDLRVPAGRPAQQSRHRRTAWSRRSSAAAAWSAARPIPTAIRPARSTASSSWRATTTSTSTCTSISVRQPTAWTSITSAGAREEFQYGGRVAIGHVTKAASLPHAGIRGDGEAACRRGRGAHRAALDRSLSDGPTAQARPQRHPRRRAGAQAPAPRRQLLAVEQQHPQSVHAVRRLLADAHGEPLRQYLPGRKAGRHARVLQHGHAAAGAR